MKIRRWQIVDVDTYNNSIRHVQYSFTETTTRFTIRMLNGGLRYRPRFRLELRRRSGYSLPGYGDGIE